MTSQEGGSQGVPVDPNQGVVVGSHADLGGGKGASSRHRREGSRGGNRIGNGKGPRGGIGIGAGRGEGKSTGIAAALACVGSGRGKGLGDGGGSGRGVRGPDHAGGKLNPGIAEDRGRANRRGSDITAGGDGPHRDGISPDVGENEGIRAGAHVVVGGLESPIFRVAGVGGDHLQGRVGSAVVADLNGIDGKQVIQKLNGRIKRVASRFELVGDLAGGVIGRPEACRAFHVIPGDVDLAHGRRGQLPEGLGRQVKLVDIAGGGTLVHHHDRHGISVRGILRPDTGSAALARLIIRPIKRHVIIGVIGPGGVAAIPSARCCV